MDPAVLRRLTRIDNIVLVLSGKGGVGKSSLSLQVALALSSLPSRPRVGILDIDLTGPSLPRMLGLNVGESSADVLQGTDGWVPVERDGLRAMSIGFLLKSERESVVWRGPKKSAMVRQFFTEVDWGQLDYLVIDTPPGTSDEHISLLELLAPILSNPLPSLPTISALLVTTPQAMSLLDVSKELSFIRRTSLPLLGLVENLSGYLCPHCNEVISVFGKGGGEDFADKEGIRFLGRIPVDRDLTALLEGGVAREGTLKERYDETGSSKVVKPIVETCVSLIDGLR